MTWRVNFRSPSVWDYTERIKRHRPFAMARWSDGEWPCVLGKQGRNTDKHEYSPTLRRDLTAVLLSRPKYVMAIQEMVVRTMAQPVHDWLEKHDLTFDWVSGDVFHRASIHDTLQPFIDELAKRGVILVGPKRLHDLDLFPIVDRIEVPPLNCHEECERVTGQTATAMAKHGKVPVVSISASMSANVIVDMLAADFPSHTVIDMGSVWEPYAGISCRSYHPRVIERLQATS